jgi:hypothetical protein
MRRPFRLRTRLPRSHPSDSVDTKSVEATTAPAVEAELARPRHPAEAATSAVATHGIVTDTRFAADASKQLNRRRAAQSCFAQTRDRAKGPAHTQRLVRRGWARGWIPAGKNASILLVPWRGSRSAS